MGLREEVEKLADKCEIPRPMSLDAIVNRDRALALAVMELTRKAQVDPLVEAAKAMRDAYAATRWMESFGKTCPTIDAFNKLLGDYE